MSARQAALLGAAAAVLVAGAIRDASAATSYPNDSFFAAGDQWGLTGAAASIDAPAAWCVSTGAGVLVADVDTGADFSHPDLAGKLVAGARFLGGSPYPSAPSGSDVSDDVGHGTMTAGIMAADTNNARGIAAVAPSARVLVVKVLQRDSSGRGSGYDSDVASGIRWAADYAGVQVINVSIGPEVGVSLSLNSDIPKAVTYAWNRGVIVALAAGNSNLPLADYQGINNQSLIVGALAPDASVASYSNSGSGVSIYAPGGDASTGGDQAQHNVVSTFPGNAYAAEAGTSFATPHVAGTLALLRALGYGAADARARILASAVTRNGVPDLDAAAAVRASGTCGAPAGQPPAAPPVGPPSAHAPSPPRAAPPPAPSAAAAPTPAPPPGTATVSPTAGAIAVAPNATPSATVPSPTVVPDAPPVSTGTGLGGRGIVIASVVGGSGVAAGGVGAVFAVIRRRRV